MKSHRRRIILDGTTKPFQRGDQVIYVSDYALKNNHAMIIDKNNLGVVTSKNDKYVFVRYLGDSHSKATYPKDLHSIHCREDLCEIIEENEKS